MFPFSYFRRPRRVSCAALPVLAALILSAVPARAHESLWNIELEGYGETLFSWKDYGLNQNRDGGAPSDSRIVFDQVRFVFEIEGEVPDAGFDFLSEIEFEHGGTGAAMELEYEEFGEYEQEVEKGGEIVVEQLFVRKRFGDHFWLKAGRFYLAMGLLSDYHRPMRYFGSGRPESETTVIPAPWDEMGLEAAFRAGPFKADLQVVNGLDSTGFSSQAWVGMGQQGRFEEIRATDLAVVGRVDVTPYDGVLIGVSGYRGGTSANRPKPDLVPECSDGNDDAVAPCGYTEAPVTIVDGHTRVEVSGVLLQGLVLWGRLDNADDVSDRNARLSNALMVLRTPVADEALATWGELGVNVLHWSRAGALHDLSPFVRYEHYDTMFKTREGLFDNPRFERNILQGGLSYHYEDIVFAKLDVMRRGFGSVDLRPETSVNLATGFEF